MKLHAGKGSWTIFEFLDKSFWQRSDVPLLTVRLKLQKLYWAEMIWMLKIAYNSNDIRFILYKIHRYPILNDKNKKERACFASIALPDEENSVRYLESIHSGLKLNEINTFIHRQMQKQMSEHASKQENGQSGACEQSGTSYWVSSESKRVTAQYSTLLFLNHLTYCALVLDALPSRHRFSMLAHASIKWWGNVD